MRLADDRRGRIPFALLGVLLLVGATTLSASIANQRLAPVDSSADTVADRIDAEIQTTLRDAIERAVKTAAREPVIEAAETPSGQALQADPFTNALRVRIYLQARTSLSDIQYHRGRTVGRVQFGSRQPSIEEALRLIEIEGRDANTELVVTVDEIKMAISRNGQVVAEEELSMTLRSGLPILAMAERAHTFETRLSRGPLTGPSVSRRATVSLTAIAQARGLSQYLGLPIDNIIANRHVQLTTNAGILDTQRAVFGQVDPDAERGVRRALLRTGVTDFVAAETDPAIADAITGGLPAPTAERALPDRSDSLSIRHSLAPVADSVFVSFTRSLHPRMESIIADGYRARVTVRAGVDQCQRDRQPRISAPRGNYSLVSKTVERDTKVTYRSPPALSSRYRDGIGTQVLERTARMVTVRYTRRTVWQHPHGSQVTRTARWQTRCGVTIDQRARMLPIRTPTRSIDPLFETGGVLDGSNLVRVSAISGDLRDSAGGSDQLARRAVLDGPVSIRETITGKRPARLDRWIRADLRQTRDELRTITLSIDGRSLTAGAVNPAAALRKVVLNRRAALRAVPVEYAGVADRARVAVRIAYLNHVLAELQAQANQASAQHHSIRDILVNHGVDYSLAQLSRIQPSPASQSHTIGSGEGVIGPVTLQPDADPPFLSTASVNGSRVDSIADSEQYIGLATRNLNVFSVPYDNAATSIIAGVMGQSGSVSLELAAQTLSAAEQTAEITPTPELETQTEILTRRVERKLSYVHHRATTTLAAETGLPRTTCDDIVTAAFERWPMTQQPTAARNGSIARLIAQEATQRERNMKTVDGRELETTIRVRLRQAVTHTQVRVSQAAVNDTDTQTRKAAQSLASSALKSAARERFKMANMSLNQLPAGIPILPTLNPWLATGNLWIVDARGRYGRFAITSPHGPITFVRSGQVVTLDVDGDGRAETLGRASRIGFSYRTVAIVVVPPGKAGVGERDGQTDERSTAWVPPTPGPRCVRPMGYCPSE